MATVAVFHDDQTEELSVRLRSYLRYVRGLDINEASSKDCLAALQLAVRETLIDRFHQTQRQWVKAEAKTVNYLSMEFLLGRLVEANLIATGLYASAEKAVNEIGFDLEEVVAQEPDPGLGNGGLGRLAACFLESAATLEIPTYGYGLRYDYGIFRQEFAEGWQREQPDTWLKGGYCWEIARTDLAVSIPLGGSVEVLSGEDENRRVKWTPGQMLSGVPHDVLIAGYGTQSVAVLRLWKAEAADEFDFHTFSRGDFLHAVAGRERAEAITRVLYPSDEAEAGRELRLTQEYFLVACSVRDVIRRFRTQFGDEFDRFPEKIAFQLNDTHPALTVAELMRVFVDEVGLSWERAWQLTKESCAYTNHTLLPEALETWPTELFTRLLPRHTQILFDINKLFLSEMTKVYPGESDRLRRLSLVQEDGEQQFRMAHLAILGSHKVNGVAWLHTKLLTSRVIPDFAALWPERFVSITNGITPRRWLLSCNPRLADAITRRIGSSWTRELNRLESLAGFAEDPDFQAEVIAIKFANKVALAKTVHELCGVSINPDSLFDVQIKRLHEYKRQLLNAMHIIALYLRLRTRPETNITPRTFIFGAKAAPAYRMAKLIIKLINAIGDVVNNDPLVADRLKVVFLPDYRVSLASRVIPAADLSEQISTAGMEASGTGNMKLALNGALTIGTLDGANVEIRDRVGDENIFIFGLTADQVAEARSSGRYDPWDVYRHDPQLAQVIDALRDGLFAGEGANSLQEIWASLMEQGDRFMHLADFRSYVDTQARAAHLYTNQTAWTAKTIRNIAAMGYFSSDRAIREYNEMIWQATPVSIDES